MNNEKIILGEPFLPKLEDFIPYLEEIWSSRVLTNNGRFLKEFTVELQRYLNIENICVTANGTLSLILALKTLNCTGKVITTPYSFIATSNCLAFSNLEPIFVDIDPHTFNIDPANIERAITEDTSAILATHCYGSPCDVEAIQRIADKNNLKVIYDAAHAFGVNYDGESITKYGDCSILSFHATKVFNTMEGGAVIFNDSSLDATAKKLRNFGITSETSIEMAGINAKMNEVAAALGLLQLKHIEDVIDARRQVAAAYLDGLSDIEGITIPCTHFVERTNASYFPLLIESDCKISRDSLYTALKTDNIYSRRYFYPLISNTPMYRNYKSAQIDKLPIANAVSSMVLCLPIHSAMNSVQVLRIIDKIKEKMGGK